MCSAGGSIPECRSRESHDPGALCGAAEVSRASARIASASPAAATENRVDHVDDLGSMQDWPLLVWKLIDHAAVTAPRQAIVTQTVEGPLHRTNWREVRVRARKVANALHRFGIGQGERVGTLAWNTHRHVECWYGISGMGAVAHTVNPRLFDDQIVYILNHAADRVLFLDLTFVELVQRLAPRLETIERFVILTDREHMPGTDLAFECYEDLLARETGDFDWAELDERSPAGLCYTSGTTGNPRGVLYTHRSNVLQTFACSQAAVFNLSAQSTVLPIVPMFHANAWALPYAAALAGAKLVMGGPHHDAITLQRLIETEGVTVTGAVPTVWLAMLQHLKRTGTRLGDLKRVVIGGSAAPRSMIEAFERDLDIEVVHAWGLTELSPLGSACTLSAEAAALPFEQQLDLKCKQGQPVFGIEMKIVDENGRELPRDGRSAGNLKVRGPWVIAQYFHDSRTRPLDEEGWFDTGDIATLDNESYMQITDRSKDVIKSGGEWISSVALENAAVGCPGIAEAAVIGVPHPRWGERPLLILVRSAESDVTAHDVRTYLSGRIAKWWMPEDIVFEASIPHTATGKIMKTALRERFSGFVSAS